MFRIRLKELRESAGLSQEAFAKAFGVAQSTVGGWESGARVPRLPMIENIAAFFNVPTSYFVDGSDEASPSSPDSPLDEHLEGIDFFLYGETKDLTDEEKQDVLDYIRYKKSKKERLPSDAYIAAHGGAIHASEEGKTPEAAREIFRKVRNEEN